MKLHKLTQAEIAALNKLKAYPLSYFKRHLPTKSSNIYIAETSEALKRFLRHHQIFESFFVLK